MRLNASKIHTRLALQVELPVWGRLDAGCGWRAFAAGAGAPAVVQAVADFAPEAVMGVDWHSLAAYEALEGALGAAGQRLAPYVFMNYRWVGWRGGW